MPTKIRTLTEKLAEIQTAMEKTGNQLQKAEADLRDRIPPQNLNSLTTFYLSESERQDAARPKIKALTLTLAALDREQADVEAELKAIKTAERAAMLEAQAFADVEAMKALEPKLDAAVEVLVAVLNKIKACGESAAYKRWMAHKFADAGYPAAGQLLNVTGVFPMPLLSFNGQASGPGADAFTPETQNYDLLAAEKLADAKAEEEERLLAHKARLERETERRAAAQQQRLDDIAAASEQEAKRIAAEQRRFDELAEEARRKTAAANNPNFNYYAVRGRV